ncbi:hypothetical protein GUJ93_ZPchr0010g8013 [Zizania palustris]|uniref:Uncharacterized protein n=1 Tax=Zizania palustris TaxID=103762 RepID=A0A8J6BKG3_ZIZPA|nr:hypothetical protein GUJ93_ZPchr0010g8013 [Zizania palustris]
MLQQLGHCIIGQEQMMYCSFDKAEFFFTTIRSVALYTSQSITPSPRPQLPASACRLRRAAPISIPRAAAPSSCCFRRILAGTILHMSPHEQKRLDEQQFGPENSHF